MFPAIRYHYVSFALTICGLFFEGPVSGQQSAPAVIIHTAAHARNIFSAQQELDLAGVEAEFLEDTYQVIPNAVFSQHITAIINRLVPSLPRGRPDVRIILIDTPEAGAFSVGSSRIYITRKMFGTLRNDDELAGLLGHELAHTLTHENVMVVSRAFHEFLSVDVVSDRKDIADKFTKMLSSSGSTGRRFEDMAKRMQKREEGDQYQADRFALFASAAAGFSPRAYADLFDRFAATGGMRGNLLTDQLGITTAEERRLREIYKSLRSIPKPCREKPSLPGSPEFLKWQAEVTAGSPRFGDDRFEFNAEFANERCRARQCDGSSRNPIVSPCSEDWQPCASMAGAKSLIGRWW